MKANLVSLLRRGVFTREPGLTRLQTLLFDLALQAERERDTGDRDDAVKALQLFTNTRLYKEVYKDELAEEARETQAEVVPVSVDIDNPDDLDAYFEYAFEQARKQAKTVETASFMTDGE